MEMDLGEYVRVGNSNPSPTHRSEGQTHQVSSL